MTTDAVAPEDSRIALVEAASRLFRIKGCEATSIGDITERAGMDIGAFYQFFQTREDILEDVVDAMIDRFSTEVRDIRDRSGDATTTILLITRLLLARLESESAFFEILKRPPNAGLSFRISAAYQVRIVPVLADVIERGMTDGEFQVSHPRAAAEIVMALILYPFMRLGLGEDGRDAITHKAVLESVPRILGVTMAIPESSNLPDASPSSCP